MLLKSRFFRFLMITALGLNLSLGVHRLPQVKAQQPIQNQGAALVQVGKQDYDAGQFSEAAQVLQQATQAYEAAADRLKQAQALSLMSLAQQKLGRWQEAQSAIDASLSLLETLPRDDRSARVRAQVLNAQGHLQLARGQAEAALETWQQAEVRYAHADDLAGVLGSQINQVQALQSLGLYRRAQKLLTQIEQQLEQSIDSPLKATGLNNLGNIRRRDGELAQSKSILTQSLAVAQRLRLPQAESQIWLSLGNTERSLAKRAEDINNATQAKQDNQEALNDYQQAAIIATAPITKIQAQLNQLSLLIEIDQLTSIPAFLPQIPEALNSLPASRASAYAHVNFAQSLMKLENREETRQNSQIIAQLLSNAIQQAESLEDQQAKSYALGTLGQLSEKTKNWSEAQKYTLAALYIAQEIDAPDLAYQWQWQMGRLLQGQSESTTHSQDGNAEAIAYYTQALRILKDLRSDLVALNPDIQFSFRESVEPVYRQLVNLLLRAEQPSKENLIQARNVIEALQIAELDNFFRDACAKPEPVNIDNLAPTAAIIYPIILSDHLEIILKLPGSDNLRHHSDRHLSEPQVDAAIEKLRNSLRKRSTSLSQVKNSSKLLYNWLIRPFEADLDSAVDRDRSQIKTLVFVLDGALRNIPPAALYDGKRYLVERYAIAVTPGLQLLDPKPLARENFSVLLVGATDAPSFRKEGFGPIDNVDTELKGIRQEVNRNQKLENQDFLQENVQQQINSTSFNIVHIATHGKFSSNPEQTFILDWDKRITVKGLDNLMQVSDPKKASPIQLLILSACETATGDKRAALGLAGVAIRAGAHSTLASLFQVNDASTAEFMIRFYQQLKNSQLTKAEALRNTQIAFLTEYAGTDYNRPYHWAPFVLVGNWL